MHKLVIAAFFMACERITELESYQLPACNSDIFHGALMGATM
jgi:hypothetical protein